MQLSGPPPTAVGDVTPRFLIRELRPLDARPRSEISTDVLLPPFLGLLDGITACTCAFLSTTSKRASFDCVVLPAKADCNLVILVESTSSGLRTNASRIDSRVEEHLRQRPPHPSHKPLPCPFGHWTDGGWGPASAVEGADTNNVLYSPQVARPRLPETSSPSQPHIERQLIAQHEKIHLSVRPGEHRSTD